jgi:hypothetical protein
MNGLPTKVPARNSGRNDGALLSEAESQSAANPQIGFGSARPLGPPGLANGSALAAPSRATGSLAAVLLLCPDTKYPDHSHDAEELYLPPAGHTFCIRRSPLNLDGVNWHRR